MVSALDEFEGHPGDRTLAQAQGSRSSVWYGGQHSEGWVGKVLRPPTALVLVGLLEPNRGSSRLSFRMLLGLTMLVLFPASAVPPQFLPPAEASEETEGARRLLLTATVPAPHPGSSSSTSSRECHLGWSVPILADGSFPKDQHPQSSCYLPTRRQRQSFL